jgi:hypothetical protein
MKAEARPGPAAKGPSVLLLRVDFERAFVPAPLTLGAVPTALRTAPLAICEY